MSQVLLFYLTLFVLGLGLHFVGAIFALAALGSEAKGLARRFLKIGLVSAYRPAVTVNASHELTLKRRKYDEHLDTEKVVFGGLMSKVTRYLRDPQDRLHRFFGVRFGFVDERTGLVYDPRDCDMGKRSNEHQEAESLSYRGSVEEGRITKQIRGVFGFETGARGVSLRDVKYLIGGSADSQAVDWLITLYKKSQEPRSQSLSVWKILAPAIALSLVLAVGAFLGGGGGGGGGGGTPTLPVGSALLLAISPYLPFNSWRQRGVAAGFAIVGGLLLAGLFVFFPTGIATKAAVSFVFGLVFLPGLAYFLGRSLGGLGMGLSKLYLILGFFPYSDPVIYLREDNEYVVEEWDDLDGVAEPEWYRFAKTWVGVTYENTEDAWPGRDSVLKPDVLKEYGETTVDVDADLPPQHAVASGISSAGHSGVVPTDPDEDRVWVQTRHGMSWFKDVGRGQLLKRALKNAKEEHFGGKDIEDNKVMYMTLGAAILGLFVDVVVFF